MKFQTDSFCYHVQGQAQEAAPGLGAQDPRGEELRDTGVHLNRMEKVMAMPVSTIDKAPAGAAL